MADRTAFDEVRELRAENERLTAALAATEAEVERRQDDVTEAYEERNHAREGWAKAQAALKVIAEGRVPLGPYGEMWQAIEAFARENV